VIAVDSNLLVYAHRRDSPWHAEARRCIATLAEGRRSWALPWPCIHEFLAIVTHPRIYRPPSSLSEALGQVESWLASPSAVVLAEAEGYWPVLREQLERARLAGPRIHDARVAALCRLHGVVELWTADRDFGRFPDVATRNPLLNRSE
jgi:toxin-antitoxin system PIN domain toxin